MMCSEYLEAKTNNARYATQHFINVLFLFLIIWVFIDLGVSGINSVYHLFLSCSSGEWDKKIKIKAFYALSLPTHSFGVSFVLRETKKDTKVPIYLRFWFSKQINRCESTFKCLKKCHHSCMLIYAFSFDSITVFIVWNKIQYRSALVSKLGVVKNPQRRSWGLVLK